MATLTRSYCASPQDYPHIDVSDYVLCYLSELWFTNPPCQREIVRAMVRGKRLIAVLEPDRTEQHGGVPEQRCRDILLSADFRNNLETVMGSQVEQWKRDWQQPSLRLPTGQEIVEALFEAQLPIVWYRLSDFQDVSMRLIAERVLQPLNTAVVLPYEQRVYMEGEIVRQVKGKLDLPPVRQDCSFHVYLSPSSPGDAALSSIAEELKAKFLPTLTWTAERSQLAQCEHMLVLLTAETWTRADESDAFAEDVCEAMRKGVHRLLVHEVVGARVGDNEARHAASFAEIIGATPGHVRDAQLYNEIAQNLGGAEWREAGLAKMAKQLCKGSGTREQWQVNVGAPLTELDDSAAGSAAPLLAGAQSAAPSTRAAQAVATTPLRVKRWLGLLLGRWYRPKASLLVHSERDDDLRESSLSSARDSATIELGSVADGK